MVMPPLKNHYLVMRHGQSLANIAGIIVSHPANGLNDYGLSDNGRQQVKQTIQSSNLNTNIHLVSSDFKRTRETAEIVHQQLNCRHDIVFDTRLRERNFGDYELGPDKHYPDVWAVDESNPEQSSPGKNNSVKNTPEKSKYNVETVQSVLQRAVAVVIDFEKQHNASTCLLIAHGDILQILQTAFYGLPPHHHRQLPHLDTAGLRALQPQS